MLSGFAAPGFALRGFAVGFPSATFLTPEAGLGALDCVFVSFTAVFPSAALVPFPVVVSFCLSFAGPAVVVVFLAAVIVGATVAFGLAVALWGLAALFATARPSVLSADAPAGLALCGLVLLATGLAGSVAGLAAVVFLGAVALGGLVVFAGAAFLGGAPSFVAGTFPAKAGLDAALAGRFWDAAGAFGPAVGSFLAEAVFGLSAGFFASAFGALAAEGLVLASFFATAPGFGAEGLVLASFFATAPGFPTSFFGSVLVADLVGNLVGDLGRPMTAALGLALVGRAFSVFIATSFTFATSTTSSCCSSFTSLIDASSVTSSFASTISSVSFSSSRTGSASSFESPLSGFIPSRMLDAVSFSFFNSAWGLASTSLFSSTTDIKLCPPVGSSKEISSSA